jgi:hypothetical protein
MRSRTSWLRSRGAAPAGPGRTAAAGVAVAGADRPGRAGFYADSRFWDRSADRCYRRLSRRQPGQARVGYHVGTVWLEIRLRIGSSKDAWTTRSVTVAIPRRRCLPPGEGRPRARCAGVVSTIERSVPPHVAVNWTCGSLPPEWVRSHGGVAWSRLRLDRCAGAGCDRRGAGQRRMTGECREV